MKLDFVGIGAIKCATTWIYECLREHPEIYVISPKDYRGISYFLNVSTSKETTDYFRSFFCSAKPYQRKGEFNESYLIKEEIINKIKEHNKNIKFIACLRNPIERAYSHYLHTFSIERKNWQPFDEVIKKKNTGGIVEVGFYFKHLKKFFENFPPKNFLVLIYEDIKGNEIEFIQRIYRFLGVRSSYIPQNAKIRVSPTKFKLTRMGKLVHRQLLPLLDKAGIGNNIRRSPIARKYFYRFTELYTKGDKNLSQNISREAREFLKSLYAEDIENLEKLIGRDLSFWK